MVSVIVPVYNVRPYLDECVYSIINQSYSNLEIILVDDGSTDESNVRCDEFSFIDSRIKVIHKTNGGLSDARNTGIKASSGEYIAFVDSDDYLDSHYIERLVAMLEEHPECGMAICGFNWFADGEPIEVEDNTGIYDVISRKQAFNNLNDWACNDNIVYIVAWNKLYRRHLWDKLVYPVGKWHEDEFMAHKLLDKVDYVAVTNDELYFYRRRQGSIVSVPSLQDTECRRFDAVYALAERVDLYYDKYPDYLEALMHYLLRKCYVLYEDYSQRTDKLARSELKKLRLLFKNAYAKSRNYLGIKERVKACAFIIMPDTYSRLAMEKERKIYG